MTPSREEYLATLRARLVAQRNGTSDPAPAPTRVDAPTLTLAGQPLGDRKAEPGNVQPSPYSESDRRDRPLDELVDLARALPPSDVEVLVLVGRRLARTEGRAR